MAGTGLFNDTSKTSMWEDHIEGVRVENGIPAIAAAIVRDGELAWFKGFGATEIGNGSPPHERSVFRVASNTKTFTATSLMLLQEASMLSLQDPLLLYLPEFTSANGEAGDLEDVTLRRLATHYSGLSTEHPATDWETPDFPTIDLMLDRIDEVSVVIPQDSQWKYSNMAYGFLGETVARLAGNSYRQFVHNELLEPLGMADTTFDRDDVAVENLVVGYSPPSPNDTDLRVAPYSDLRGLTSAGQMMTNCADLAKWLSFHMNAGGNGAKRLLSEASMREMHHPAYLDETWAAGQCIGWRAARRGDNVFLGHGGGIHGFGTMTLFHGESKTGVIVLTNLWPNVATGDLATDLLEMVVTGADESPAPTESPSRSQVEGGHSQELASIEGEYFAEPGFWVQISAISDDSVHLGSHEVSPYLLHAPTSAQRVSDLIFKVQEGRGVGELIEFSDEQFVLGGFKYRKVNGK